MNTTKYIVGLALCLGFTSALAQSDSAQFDEGYIANKLSK